MDNLVQGLLTSGLVDILLIIVLAAGSGLLGTKFEAVLRRRVARTPSKLDDRLLELVKGLRQEQGDELKTAMRRIEAAERKARAADRRADLAAQLAREAHNPEDYSRLSQKLGGGISLGTDGLDAAAAQVTGLADRDAPAQIDVRLRQMEQNLVSMMDLLRQRQQSEAAAIRNEPVFTPEDTEPRVDKTGPAFATNA